MTFDERLELTLEMLQLEMLRAGSEEGLLYSQRKRLRHEAISAIKQAMRETTLTQVLQVLDTYYGDTPPEVIKKLEAILGKERL